MPRNLPQTYTFVYISTHYDVELTASYSFKMKYQNFLIKHNIIKRRPVQTAKKQNHTEWPEDQGSTRGLEECPGVFSFIILLLRDNGLSLLQTA